MEHERRGISQVLRALAESSSWHGVPKIASSRQWAVKCLWSLLLLAAFAVMLWNLSELFMTYHAHPTQTSVTLQFSSHRFPAVSFCNLNPVRRSMIGLSPQLEEIIYEQKSTESSGSVTKSPPIATSTSHFIESIDIDNETAQNAQEASRSGNETSVTDVNHDNIGNETSGRKEGGDAECDPSDYDEYYGDWFNWLFCNSYLYPSTNATAESEDEVDDDITELESDPRGRWEEVTRTFKTRYRNESENKRKQMGHQREDFIRRVTFALRKQNVSKDIKQFTSADYGNCFTMDAHKYKAWRSGPDHGIKLRLNLEVDEYINNFASGYGVRMVFHEPGSLPMPAEEGLTLSPGYETMIGLKVVNITRLGEPFGKCSDGEDFRRRYNVSYSITACMEFCRVERTIRQCNCIPYDSPDVDYGVSTMNVCDNQNLTEEKCADRINYKFENGKTTCSCIRPCRETRYEKTLSGRRWPNKDYLEKVLMADLCGRKLSLMEDACEQLKNKTFDYERYRYNFVRVRIYFEDLNYEQITQEELYKPVRFVSDIGGAMGLFLGASLLSILELFQVILEVVLYLKKPQTRTRPADEETCRRNSQNVKVVLTQL